MADNSVTEQSGEKLSDLFDKIWQAYGELENTSEPSNSDKIQGIVQNSIALAEKAIYMVNELSLFSTNETIEEVSTKEVRYLLLPALLGYLMNKTTKIERFDAVQKSQVYFIDFLRLCKLYGLTDCKLPKPFGQLPDAGNEDNQQHVVAPADHTHRSFDLAEESRHRQAKVDRFRRQKELEQKLKELVVHTKDDHVDEERMRSYYLTLVHKWITESLENLDSIEAELPILQHMYKTKMNNVTTGVEQPEKRKPVEDKPRTALRPFIITKDQVQKAVFGLGYPSMPTVTVDEFYKQRVQEGLFPSADSQQTVVLSKEERDKMEDRQREKEAAEKERKEEAEDVDALRQARNWDDWKDDHRRGWGNTQNKG
jgi:immunoglobulin-binding protein 1